MSIRCGHSREPGVRCRPCALASGAAYRRAHRSDLRAYDRARGDDAAVRRRWAAGALVATAVRRRQIVPPLRCDACTGESLTLSWHQVDPHDPRALVWTCARCWRTLRAIGGTITAHWTWPGALVPRGRPPSWSPRGHAVGSRAALGVKPTTVAMERYAQAYAEVLGASAYRSWLWAIWRDHPSWRTKVPVSWVSVWQWYATGMVDRERARSWRLGWTNADARSFTLLPALVPTRGKTRSEVPRKKSEVRGEMSEFDADAAIRAFDAALAAFDTTVEAVLHRAVQAPPTS